MELKNPNISQANPDVEANREFINAVYQEAQGRYATEADVADLKKRGLTSVKDIANVVLGAAASPFYGGAAVKPQDKPAAPAQPQQPAQPAQQPGQPAQPAPAQKQATFINQQGQKVVVDIADKARQQSLEAQGYGLMGADDKPVGGVSPEKKPAGEQDRFTPEGIDQLTGKEAGEGIQALVESGRVFDEKDAQNYAFSTSEQNWHQFVGGIGGERNVLYIGPSEWARLQKTYTPYQIQQATERTPYGSIQWSEGINIADIPREDPADTMNKEVDFLSGLITDAKGLADILTKDGAKKDGFDLSLLGIDTGATSEDIYNELYNTPEMLDAQKEVSDLKSELDEFDQQLEELRDDIRKEVEGEASDSYITAKTTIRGQDILKQRRQKQRDYDTAIGSYNSLKENATLLMEFRIRDNETRYNRMFAEIQFIAQRQDSQFNKDMAILEVAFRIPEGESITLPNGTQVIGRAEDDNINVVQFTDADRNVYIIGMDKNTGKEVYRQLLGQSPAPQGAAPYIDKTPYQTLLGETTAQQSLEWMADWTKRMEAGEIGTEVTEDGKAFYYDKKAYEEAIKDQKGMEDQWWNPLTYGGWGHPGVKPEDYFIDYQ